MIAGFLFIAVLTWAVVGICKGGGVNDWRATGVYHTPCIFSPWGLVRYGSMYRAHIAESYDRFGNRVKKKP